MTDYYLIIGFNTKFVLKSGNPDIFGSIGYNLQIERKCAPRAVYSKVKAFTKIKRGTVVLPYEL